ncbi:MAG: glutamate--tRNA ligase, partial [Candidatus Sericytochromatia bacterium]
MLGRKRSGKLVGQTFTEGGLHGSEKVRVRFAPSPTGHLHVGGARTALFNWLYARHTGGEFVLRIEDTDRARSTDASVQAIFEGMSWLGLTWDEGPGKEGPLAPYFQTERLDTYRAYADKLVAAGRAYKCYLTAEELAAKREEAAAAGAQPRYNRAWCSDAIRAEREAQGLPFVLRFKAPDSGTIVIEDLVKGTVSFEATEMVDDFVLVKNDGIPHVLRGDDHLSNTPKQIAVYEALGLPLPKFGHIPMILGADKTRLSKRHGATSVMQYHDEGYLAQAMVNYLVRLGWSHGDQEIFTPQEMIDLFTTEGINKTASVFDNQKLEWLNAHYIKSIPTEELVALATPFWAKAGLDVAAAKPEWLAHLANALKERSRTLVELAAQSMTYVDREVEYDQAAVTKFLTPANKPMLEALHDRLTALATWDEAALEPVVKGLAEELGL